MAHDEKHLLPLRVMVVLLPAVIVPGLIARPALAVLQLGRVGREAGWDGSSGDNDDDADDDYRGG